MARYSIQSINQVEENRDTYATEPVTVAEVKAYLQLDATAYDTVLEVFITAARQMIENYCNVSLVPKEIWAQIRNQSDRAFPLPFSPIESVEAVLFKRCQSATEDLVLDEEYFINNEYSKQLEITSTKVCNPKQFFMVHYYTVADERAVFQQAIKAQAGYMFNNRDSDKETTMAPETKALIQAFKINYF